MMTDDRARVEALKKALTIAEMLAADVPVSAVTRDHLAAGREAITTLNQSLAARTPEPGNPCAKIFDHKWLDPECVETGCKSLLPRRLVQDIAQMPLPNDPHTDAWQLGFCRARKRAAELVQSQLGPERAPTMTVTPSAAVLAERAAEFRSLATATRKFTNSAGNDIHIEISTGANERNFCRMSMLGPESGCENYTTWDELVQLHSALSELLAIRARTISEEG